MKQQNFMNLIVLLVTLSTVNGFWWGSSARSEEEEDPIKKIPVHILRTLTYHPVLIPNNPVGPPPPMAPFQYGRGFLSQYQGNPSLGMNPYAASSNNYNTYQTNPPPTPSSTTQRPTTTVPQTTTTTTPVPSTTTEATTTFQAPQSMPVQDPYPQMTGKISAKSPLSMNDRMYNQLPYDYMNGASHMAASAKGQDPYNLQYVTNIAPMNVQFVPCMCPVEVRINSNDQLPLVDKSSEDPMLEPVNDLDDNLE